MPHGGEGDESGAEDSHQQDLATKWPTSADEGLSPREANVSLAAPLDSGVEAEAERDRGLPATDSAPVDPFEEIARLAGQYASIDKGPVAYNGQSSNWPPSTATTDDALAEVAADAATVPGEFEAQGAPAEVGIDDGTCFDPEALENAACEAAIQTAAIDAVILEAVSSGEDSRDEDSRDGTAADETVREAPVQLAAQVGAIVLAVVLEEVVEEAAPVGETVETASSTPEGTTAQSQTHQDTAPSAAPVLDTDSRPAATPDTMASGPESASAEETAIAEGMATEAVSADKDGRDGQAGDSEVAENTEPANAVPGLETHDLGQPQRTQGAEESAEQAAAEDSSWPFGERRSAARQARKPLPAALQEAVAAGAAQDLADTGSQSASGQPSASTDSSRGAKADGPGAATVTGRSPDTRTPGIVRRYGSAIAIVVLFLVAGGVAAGIAAFRGPVNTTPPSTAPQDRAAAAAAVLTAASFPRGWHFSRPSNAVSSYGLGAALVTPSVVRAWLGSHPSCTAGLTAVSAAMTPTVGNLTAVAYSEAATTNPLGGPWQIADAVAFHTSPAQVGADLAKMQTTLGQPKSQQCVAQFWAAALMSKLPKGSTITMSVSPRAFPSLPGNPAGWAMQMQGTEVVGQSTLPLRFQITSFGEGRAQVFFAVSSRAAALPNNLAAGLLMTLAVRGERLGTPGA